MSNMIDESRRLNPDGTWRPQTTEDRYRSALDTVSRQSREIIGLRQDLEEALDALEREGKAGTSECECTMGYDLPVGWERCLPRGLDARDVDRAELLYYFEQEYGDDPETCSVRDCYRGWRLGADDVPRRLQVLGGRS